MKDKQTVRTNEGTYHFAYDRIKSKRVDKTELVKIVGKPQKDGFEEELKNSQVNELDKMIESA